MATHSSVLAWRIPGTGEPHGLLSMGSQSRTQLKWLSSSSSSIVLEMALVHLCCIIKRVAWNSNCLWFLTILWVDFNIVLLVSPELAYTVALQWRVHCAFMWMFIVSFLTVWWLQDSISRGKSPVHNWRRIAFQCCVSFRCTPIWIRDMSPPSLPPPSDPSRSSQTPELGSLCCMVASH